MTPRISSTDLPQQKSSEPHKTLINPGNETVQKELLRIKHKRNATTHAVKKQKKVMEILRVDEESGQIIIDNKSKFIQALNQPDDEKKERARQKFLKQLENAHFTINKNKLQVVLEEYTEEDCGSGDEGSNLNRSQLSYEQSDKSTVYS